MSDIENVKKLREATGAVGGLGRLSSEVCACIELWGCLSFIEFTGVKVIV